MKSKKDISWGQLILIKITVFSKLLKHINLVKHWYTLNNVIWEEYISVHYLLVLWLESVLWILTSIWQDAGGQMTNARETKVEFHIYLKLTCKYWPCPEAILKFVLWSLDSPTGYAAGAQVGRGHVFQSCEQDSEALAEPVQFFTQVTGNWCFCRIPALGSVLKGYVHS